MKIDILAFGAHPDDVELGAAGTLAKHAALGHKTAIVDLTQGEMGTRGTPEIRLAEAKQAATLLGCSFRENLSMRDGFIRNNEESLQRIIQVIRQYQPEVVLCNAPTDRHPDHGNAATLVLEASFLAGLRKLETTFQGSIQAPWRPKKVYQYIQFLPLQPTFIVDITGFYDQKIASVKAHASQFYNPASDEPETVIASKYFFDSIEGRSREFGRSIYTEHGEGFIAKEPVGLDNIFAIK